MECELVHIILRELNYFLEQNYFQYPDPDASWKGFGPITYYFSSATQIRFSTYISAFTVLFFKLHFSHSLKIICPPIHLH